MVRFAFAGLAMLAVAGAVAAEEDNGPALVDLFARTCALRPALPSGLDRIASGLGFVKDGGAISADMEVGPRIDIVYSARLMKRGVKFGLMAYFEGRADGPTVACGLTTFGVSAQALPGLIEKALNVRDRTGEAAADASLLRAGWRIGAASDGDTLEMTVRRDQARLGAIDIKYRGRKR
jgi:hypothetical protein